MKTRITKRHLRKIINEEVNRVLKTMDEQVLDEWDDEIFSDIGDFMKDEVKLWLHAIDRIVAGPNAMAGLSAIETLVADKKRELEGEGEAGFADDPEAEPNRELEPEDPQRAIGRAERAKNREAIERAWADEIRKKMKQYPPKKPMRPEIANLLDRYPEEEETLEA